MKIDIKKIKLDIENNKSANRILLHELTKHSVKEIEDEYFKHLNLKK